MTGRYFLLLYCIIGNIMNITEISHKIKAWIKTPIAEIVIILVILIISNIASFYLGKSSNSYINDDYIENESTLDYSLADPQIYKQGSLAAAVYSTSLNTQNDVISQNIGQNREVVDPSLNTPNLPTSRYVASKNGRVYYFTWCAGGKNIDQEKRIYFNSAQDARAAGYKASTACAGLD